MTNRASRFEGLLTVVSALVFLAAGVYWWSGQAAGAASQPEYTTGVDTIAITIVSDSCKACEIKSEVAAFRNAHERLRTSPGRRIRVVGVAVDPDVGRGRRRLAKLGPFSEISSGGGWTNSVAVEYIWADTLALPAIPQLVVVERNQVVDEQHITVESERVVDRVYGMHAMARWLADSMERSNGK
jgi:hypothetical protein